jgi:hypothetical protein
MILIQMGIFIYQFILGQHQSLGQLIRFINNGSFL